MARRRSTLEDLIDLLKMRPWWVSTLLAPLSYWFLISYAPNNQLHNIYLKALLRGLAPLAPYAAGGLLLLSVAILARQWHRRLLLDRQKDPGSIRSQTWLEFEWLIGEAFRRQGYNVLETGLGPDGGVEFVLLKHGVKTLVQCKHWKRTRIGVGPMRELLGSITAKGAHAGIFVCSGEFTQPAIQFANDNNIRLIDGMTLEAMIRDVKKHPKASANPILQPIIAHPACPRCGSSMTQRYAKRGPKAGQAYWGCTGFPRCRGVVSAG